MSELKDLTWAVQETVSPLPFEALERRGVLRRRRRRVVAGAGVVTAAAVVVLVAVLPFGAKIGTEKPPVATVPTAPAPAVDKVAQALTTAPTSVLTSVQLATPTRWAATWQSCPSGACSYTTVLSRDGVKVFAPPRRTTYSTLKWGEETIAAVGPFSEHLEADDPTWADAMMVRLTADEMVTTPLHWAKPTKTFGPDEILTDQIGGAGQLRVLNPKNATLRELETSNDQYGSSPVRDSTGRWWMVRGQSGDATDSYVAWTDDGGKTWDQTLLDPDNPASRIAVSPDGRTILASSHSDGTTPEAIQTMKVSTDRGAHWRTATNTPWGRAGGPIVFDDQTAIFLGQQPNDPTASVYGVADGKAKLLNGAPDLQDSLSGDGRLMYGVQLEAPTATKVAMSTDRGKTWSSFEAR